MIKNCVHEIMLFCVSTGLCVFVARLPVFNYLYNYCGCLHIHTDYVSCEIYITCYHSAGLIQGLK